MTGAPLVLPGSIADLAARASRRAAYLASSLSLPPVTVDEVADLIRRAWPRLRLVNARGLYRSNEDWRNRWPQERERYGALIAVTAAEAASGEEAGEHTIGAGVAQEIVDFVAMGRPVLWTRLEAGRLDYCRRFEVGALDFQCAACLARLRPAPDAAPFVPAIDLALFDSFLIVEPRPRRGEE